jgi:hypothetical protein
LILVVVMSGTALIATTGIAAGVLMLGTALAGFHDLAEVRRAAGKTTPSKVVLPTNVGVQL